MHEDRGRRKRVPASLAATTRTALVPAHAGTPGASLVRSPGGARETPLVPGPDGPLGAALERVGDRWTLLVVWELLEGPRRFNDLVAEVQGIAPNILSQRLKQLEREGIVVARPYSRRPLRFGYELTADGQGLAGALRLLADWGAQRSNRAAGMRHAACGTPVEARWYCPTCARPVEDEEAGQLEFV